MSPEVLQALWHLKLSFSHNLLAKLHESMRCYMVSLCFLQLGQYEGPWNPLLMRLSHVRIILWQSNHMKLDTLGQIPGVHMHSQTGFTEVWA